MELLWDVVRERGLTVLCTLHQLDIAVEFGDRILGMKAGHLEIDQRADRVNRASLDALYSGHVRVDAQQHPDAAEAVAA